MRPRVVSKRLPIGSDAHPRTLSFLFFSSPLHQTSFSPSLFVTAATTPRTPGTPPVCRRFRSLSLSPPSNVLLLRTALRTAPRAPLRRMYSCRGDARAHEGRPRDLLLFFFFHTEPSAPRDLATRRTARTNGNPPWNSLVLTADPDVSRGRPGQRTCLSRSTGRVGEVTRLRTPAGRPTATSTRRARSSQFNARPNSSLCKQQ